jgi:MoaA/NifB/PqqE/SkfB family radical SAM enzyme
MMHDRERSVLTTDEIGDLTPLEIFEHKNFEQLRADGLNEVKNKNCDVCWGQEKRGLTSPRLKSVGDTSWPLPAKNLREFDLSFSNKCNLVCRMCNLGSSHQFYKDYEFFKTHDLIDDINTATSHSTFPDRPNNTNTEHNKQLDWIRENYRSIGTLKISGGEPLYDKKVVELLRLMVDNNHAKNVDLELHTNATLLRGEIVELLNNFKSQGHTFSVDGTEKTYEYIRHLSSFSLIEDNIIQWIYRSSNIQHIKFNLVLSALNVLNLREYFEWIGDTFRPVFPGPKFIPQVHVSEVRPYNRGIALHHLPTDLLRTASARFGLLRRGSVVHDYGNTSRMIELAISNNKCDKQKLLNEVSLFDRSRNQHYRDFVDPLLIEVLE